MGRIEKLWVENFRINLESNNFSKSNVKALSYVINTFPPKLNKKTIILVGAGPSLDENLQLLQQVQNSAIILSSDVVAPTLIRNNIKPDFICTVDPHETIPNILSSIADIPIIAPVTTNPLLFKSFKGNIYLFNPIDEVKEKNELLMSLNEKAPQMSYIYNSLFVGGNCLQISSIFKPEKVLLLGYDLAFTNNKVYCEGVLEDRFKISSYATKEEFEQALLSTSIIYSGIKTSKLFIIYAKMFMRLVQGSKLKVINCSKGSLLTQLPYHSLEDFKEEFKQKISKSKLKNY